MDRKKAFEQQNDEAAAKGAEELCKAIDKDIISGIYQDTINEIAGKHLGSKQGDYSAYKDIKYVDKSLLVSVPRDLNRQNMKPVNDGAGFIGIDVWRGYEVSCLLNNGFPINFVATVVYAAESPNIIESKSMKLYWNSFNMMRCGVTVDDAIKLIKEIATENLATATGDPLLFVELFPAHLAPVQEKNLMGGLTSLLEIRAIEETYQGVLGDFSDITSYNDNPDLLVGRSSVRGELFTFKSTSLRSNCRITNQPDFGDIVVRMSAGLDGLPTEISLLKYIVSMRGENHFHEEICERVYSVLWDTFKPDNLAVECFYTRRGGWDINPFRYSSATASNFMRNKFNLQKSLRQ